MGEMIGKQSVKFAEAPYIFEGASVVEHAPYSPINGIS